jgi:hypothetical protein
LAIGGSGDPYDRGVRLPRLPLVSSDLLDRLETLPRQGNSNPQSLPGPVSTCMAGEVRRYREQGHVEVHEDESKSRYRPLGHLLDSVLAVAAYHNLTEREREREREHQAHTHTKSQGSLLAPGALAAIAVLASIFLSRRVLLIIEFLIW